MSIPEHDAWLDLGPVQREWREFVHWYPDAKFVLNTREVNHWLISRLNHLYGRYVEFMNVSCRRNATWQEWAKEWRQEFSDHEQAVMDHFRGQPNFLRFDIERDNLQILADFLGIPPADSELPRENVTKEQWFFLQDSEITTGSPGSRQP